MESFAFMFLVLLPSLKITLLVKAPGRFTQKPVPSGTIGLGWFAQNFERDCSHNITGLVRSKFNLLGQFTIFNFRNEKKKNVFIFFE